VHHVILFEAAGAQATTAARLDRASGGRGWTCFGGPNLGFDLASPNASLRSMPTQPIVNCWPSAKPRGCESANTSDP